MDPETRLQALCQDRERGASELTGEAATLLAEVARSSKRDPREAVLEAGLALIDAHPPMASLVHLTDRALVLLDQHGAEGLSQLATEHQAAAEAAAEHLAQRLSGTGHVVTYSRSGTVLAGLERLLEGQALSVTLSEGAPGREGVGVARCLHEAGARVRLTTDAGLFQALADADVLVVGADALGRHGFVNKVGTGALGRVAGAHGLDRLVACTLDKRAPPGYPVPSAAVETKVQAPSLPRLDRKIALFETVAYRLVDEVVTEQGPLTPEAIAERIEGTELHPALRDRLS